MFTRFALLSTLFVTQLTGCAALSSDNKPRVSSPLASTFEAHGGYARWQQQRMLTYTLHGFPLSPQVQKPNTSFVDLRSRRNRIEGVEFTVGFDGNEAWSIPEKDAAGLPTRFFNLGSFYFIGMPFVFGDPGVIVQATGAKSFRGKGYDTYRVTYANDTGHTDDDDYVLYVDPNTDRLRLIHHSVTELNPDMRVVWMFDAWQEVDGLLMVRKLTFHQSWNGGDLPAEGAVTIVRDMKFSTEEPADSLYTPPANAIVQR